MKKNIYFFILVILLIFSIFSYLKILPKKIEEENTINYIVVELDKNDFKYLYENYTVKKEQKRFTKTNEKLNKKNQFFLVTKAKFIDDIKKNKNISIKEKRDIYKYVDSSEKDNIINFEKFPKDLTWFQISFFSNFITSIYVLIGICYFLFNKFSSKK